METFLLLAVRGDIFDFIPKGKVSVPDIVGIGPRCC